MDMTMGKQLRCAAVLGCALGLGLAAGCAASRKAGDFKPEWVDKGSGIFMAGGKRVFLGVGSARGIRNQKLAAHAANDWGRAKVSKLLNNFLAGMLNDLGRASARWEPSPGERGGHFGPILKMFRSALGLAKVVDQWRDPADGTAFALVRLDLDDLKLFFGEDHGLDAKILDFLRDHADQACDERLAGSQH